MRQCKRCGEIKPLDRFRPWHNGRIDGVRTTCRDCDNQEQRERTIRRRERRRFEQDDPYQAIRALFVVEDEPWREQAACRGLDTNIFFPPQGTQAKEITALINQTCAICPVKAECLAYSEKTHARHGIWGGLGEKARREWRKAAS